MGRLTVMAKHQESPPEPGRNPFAAIWAQRLTLQMFGNRVLQPLQPWHCRRLT